MRRYSFSTRRILRFRDHTAPTRPTTLVMICIKVSRLGQLVRPVCVLRRIIWLVIRQKSRRHMWGISLELTPLYLMVCHGESEVILPPIIVLTDLIFRE